jgi:hypothetical protein
MQWKASLILLMALALTLTVGTVAIGAPKEKRTVCQDGITKEIPVQAKAKGATEGPCEETPPEVSDAERVCTERSGTFVPPDMCDVPVTGASWGLEDGRVIVTYDGIRRERWNPEAGYYADWVGVVSYTPTRCFDTWYDLFIPFESPRCQLPTV